MKTWRLLVALLAVACGGGAKSQPSKGSTAKTAEAAKSSSTRAGTKAKAATSQGTTSGQERDGVTCDSALEGIGFCASDAQIVFCSGESWWVLDCGAIEASAFCGTELDTGLVDCWASAQ